MNHIYKQRSQYEAKVDIKRCRQAVSLGGRMVGFHQCRNPGKFEGVIEGEKYLFCKMHDPKRVQEKRRARTEKWELERDLHRAQSKLSHIRDDIADLVLNRETFTQIDFKTLKEKANKAQKKIASVRTGIASASKR